MDQRETKQEDKSVQLAKIQTLFIALLKEFSPAILQDVYQMAYPTCFIGYNIPSFKVHNFETSAYPETSSDDCFSSPLTSFIERTAYTPSTIVFSRWTLLPHFTTTMSNHLKPSLILNSYFSTPGQELRKNLFSLKVTKESDNGLFLLFTSSRWENLTCKLKFSHSLRTCYLKTYHPPHVSVHAG